MRSRVLAWQLAFLCGLSLGIAIAAAAFGASAMTAVFGLAAVIVTLINALTGAPQESIARGGTLGSWARRVLNIGPVLKTATIVVWIGNLAVVSGWATNTYRQSQKVDVKGIVLTNDGVAAPNAVVTLSVDGVETSTVATTGQFTFEQAATLSSRRTSVRARWTSPAGETLDGSTPVLVREPAVRQGVRLRLRPGRPPFNLSFLTLKGHSIDLLIRDQLPAEWVRGSPGRLVVARTPVSDILAQWTEQYSDEVGELLDAKFTPARGGKFSTLRSDELPLRIHRAAYLVGTAPPVGLTTEWQLRLSDANAFKGALSRAAPWMLRDSGSSTAACRFATQALLLAVASRKSRELFKSLSAHGLPDDFALVDAYSDECAGNYVLELHPRLIQVRVAVFEATERVTLGAFGTRISVNQGFRAQDRVDSDIRALTAADGVFVRQDLNRGDTLAVPLQIEFAVPVSDWKGCLPEKDERVSQPLAGIPFEFLRTIADPHLVQCVRNR